MNENVGTTKLLWLSRDQTAPPSQLLTDSVAIRIGLRSSSIALVDGTDANKLLIFQITYTEDQHAALCVNFLARGDASSREKVRRVFADRMAPEFAAQLPQFTDKICLINYVEQLPKAAGLLFALSACHVDILYPVAGGGDGLGDSGCHVTDTCLLIDSTEAGSHVTRVSSGQRSTSSLPEATHRVLDAARKVLATTSGIFQPPAGAVMEGEPVDFQLAHLLHNLSPSALSDASQSALAKCVQPALQAYADVIKDLPLSSSSSGGGGGGGGGGTNAIFICDCIFSSEFCRQALLDAVSATAAAGTTVRFVKDAGLLAFLGALTQEEE